MPDHPFEQLGDQRFQEFCQALLTEQFPQLQCLPVAQPDGGRDALLRRGSKDAVIFQVKFARSPDRLKSPEKWVTDVLMGELPKIRRLVNRGATRYMLLTNISASAHLDKGSVDRVQRRLAELIPISAVCWWRDDLNRRLDNAFDLKLAYPELFTGNDYIRMLVERDKRDPEAQRRRRLITSYLADQYEKEREVRFKQADLSNDLLGVFIDVPAAPKSREALDWDTPGTRLLEAVSTARAKWRSRRFDELREPYAVASVGAGSLLLDASFQEHAPRVAIEGAPGQGKSTMLQYVCQIHRLRLLDKPEIAEVPPTHASSPVRLPIKVDLRDLAQWLSGKSLAEASSDVPHHLRTLEGFVAAQIMGAAGGARFEVDDLQAAVAESKVLLALDGLDEVVDIADRGAVIDAITAGVQRLDPIAASLQVVVTSRPASFAGTASLPDTLFQQLHLQSISRELVDDYADKWILARGLDTREKAELKEILDAKLKQAHIRDLAHNPMQLAILLNLVHRRGKALPDQRTELYSSYMEIFLDREADKSEAVRNHRGLLMTLHGHIAWLLHCQAEKQGEGGRFTTEKIERVVQDFLVSKKHPPDLFGNLFAGVFDRVGALVSRVQNTYEFEVQPLREFFAARYLYQTAPHSAPGSRQKGTRPERFDAIVRHPYWLNVTRFYAGSYDIGELASLADRLAALRKDPAWKFTPHPRMVSAQLLADWTFQQELSVQERVVTPLAKDLRTRGSISDQTDPYAGGSQGVPNDCGGAQIVANALDLLRKECRWDRRGALAAVVNGQIQDVEERRVRWLEGMHGLVGQERDLWIRSSYQLRLNRTLRPADIGSLKRLSDGTIEAILYAEQFSAFDRDEFAAEQATRVILDRPETGQIGADGERHPLPALSEALRLDTRLGHRGVSDCLEQGAREAANPRPGYSQVYAFLAAVHGLLKDEPGDWRRSLTPWNLIVEEGRRLFGDKAALTDIAVVAAGVQDRSDRGGKHNDLFDPRLALCRRARYARFKTGDMQWWKEVIAQASSEEESVLALALCWSWCSEKVLTGLGPTLTEMSAGGGEEMISRLLRLISRAEMFSPSKAQGVSDISWLNGSFAEVGFACVSRRLPERVATEVVKQQDLFFQPRLSAAVLNRLWPYQSALLADDGSRWDAAIQAIAAHYRESGWTPLLRAGVDGLGDIQIPQETARRMVKAAERLPVELVAAAENVCLADAQTKLTSVGEIAVRDSWFPVA